MKYSVSINEKKRTVTVTLADGTKGVARCCPSDQFNISTGIELALERAKTANKKAPLSIMELVKALETALPKGQMVLVGKGEEMTEAQKQWLRSIVGGECSCKCHEDNEDNEEGSWYTEDEIEDIKSDAYAKGHDDGYDEGYDAAKSENIDIKEQRDEYEAALDAIREHLEEVGII